ncbi:MAG: SDR family oxidoreductase [Acidimicrobiales bacterium]
MRIAVAGATGRVGRHVVDVLQERGHDVVSISRSLGVDVITGEGLDAALAGVDVIVDATTGPSPDEDAATEFFTTATQNLQKAGEWAGVQRIVVVSIIGTDRLAGGYGVAKVAHERAMEAGPIPARILRAAQFHEFVDQLVDWGRQGDVAYVPRFRTQLVAARTVAEALADLATADDAGRAAGPPYPEIAGPREENLVDVATLLTSRRGDPVQIVAVSDPDDPNRAVYESGALLPGPHAILAGPTFEEWLGRS